jgi:hypothetical protein
MLNTIADETGQYVRWDQPHHEIAKLLQGQSTVIMSKGVPDRAIGRTFEAYACTHDVARRGHT